VSDPDAIVIGLALRGRLVKSMPCSLNALPLSLRSRFSTLHP